MKFLIKINSITFHNFIINKIKSSQVCAGFYDFGSIKTNWFKSNKKEPPTFRLDIFKIQIKFRQYNIIFLFIYLCYQYLLFSSSQSHKEQKDNIFLFLFQIQDKIVCTYVLRLLIYQIGISDNFVCTYVIKVCYFCELKKCFENTYTYWK